MTSRGEMVAFWLRPAARESEFFGALIRELAARYDAPIFEPHVTLHGGAIRAGRAMKVLDTLSAQRPLQLEVERIAFSNEFTKTLFVQFRTSMEAEHLSGKIEGAAPTTERYHFDPHLSLLYRAMPRIEKAKLARRVTIPFRAVTFDSIQVIAGPDQIRARADVEGWRVLGQRLLAS